jgi:pimeloyl-ACP methyl ester carboxylesterase
MSCEQGFIEAADGVRLSYMEWKPPEVHSAVMFIHGIGLDCSSAPYSDRIPIPKLSGLGTAFYSIDLRGHGKSGGSIDGISQYTLIEDIDRHIERIVSARGHIPIFLYGHNFGGMLSLYYASERPGNVAGVIVSEYSTLINLNFKKIIDPGPLASLRDILLNRLRPDSKRFKFLTPQEYERICDMYNIPVDSGILRSLESSSSSGKCASYGRDFFRACGVGRERKIANKVTLPVLMIFSRNDPFFDIRGAYDIITHVQSYDKELTQIDGSGHYNIIELSHDVVGKWVLSRLPKNI